MSHPFEKKSRLEIFATQQTEGWTCTGFDVDGRDIRDFIKEKKHEPSSYQQERFLSK